MIRIFLVIIIIVSACGPVFGQICECVAPGDPGFMKGVIWQGNRNLDLYEIVPLLAPILWFSSDEPLLIEGKGPLPHPHPCDPDQSGPVVYYQVHQVRLSGDSRVTLSMEEDPRFWEKVSRLTIRFFFYYMEDRGLGGHIHDLETVEMEAELATTAS